MLRVAYRPGSVRCWVVLLIEDGQPTTVARYLSRSEAITAIATLKENR